MAKRAAKPETAKTLSVLPVQLRPGDIFTDDRGTWEVVGQPRSQRAGKSVVAVIRERSASSGGRPASASR